MDHDLHLTGPVVSLVPLRPDHAEGLAAISDAESLAWHTQPLPLTPEVARANIEALLANPGTTALAVLSTDGGDLRGITSFYDHVPSVPRV